MTRQTIPVLSPRATDEAPDAYGLRAFRWVLEGRDDPRGPRAWNVPTDALELALSASQLFVSHGTPGYVLAPVSEIRRQMVSTLERRRSEARQSAVPPPPVEPPAEPKRPGGQRVACVRPQPLRPSPSASVRPF